VIVSGRSIERQPRWAEWFSGMVFYVCFFFFFGSRKLRR